MNAPLVIDTSNVIVQGNTTAISLSVDTSNTTTVPVTVDTSQPSSIPYEDKTREHIDEDYAFARQNLYEVMKRATKALEELANIATASQAIRAYEAMAPMIKAVSEANEKLLILQNNRQALEEQERPEPNAPGVVHNHGNTVVFVGTTADLLEQRRLQQQQQQ